MTHDYLLVIIEERRLSNSINTLSRLKVHGDENFSDVKLWRLECCLFCERPIASPSCHKKLMLEALITKLGSPPPTAMKIECVIAVLPTGKMSCNVVKVRPYHLAAIDLLQRGFLIFAGVFYFCRKIRRRLKYSEKEEGKATALPCLNCVSSDSK